MPNTTFIDKQTRIEADWCQDMNDFKYVLFDGAETKADAAKAIGAGGLTPGEEQGQVPLWDEGDQVWVPGARSQLLVLQGPITFSKGLVFNTVVFDSGFDHTLILDGDQELFTWPGQGEYTTIISTDTAIDISQINMAVLYSTFGTDVPIRIIAGGSATITPVVASGNVYQIAGDIEQLE